MLGKASLETLELMSTRASTSEQMQVSDASFSQHAMYEAESKILANRAYTVFQYCLDNPDGSQARQPTQLDCDAQDFPNLDSVTRAIEKVVG